jgi:glycosyltransferase involved in cell wall biosynthesis
MTDVGSAHVLVTCSTFEPGFRGAGPVRSVAQIVDSAPPDLRITLLTRDRDLGDGAPYPGLSGRSIQRGRVEVCYLDVRNPRQWLAVIRRLRGDRFGLLYTNSLWDVELSLLPVVLVLLRVLRVERVLVAPRGQLSTAALGLKSRKKAFFLRAVKPLMRMVRPFWHASSEIEAADLVSSFEFARGRVLISSDRVSIDAGPTPTVFDDAFVFIGRIAPIKNLHLVLEALAGVMAPCSLHIYGPIEDREYWHRCDAIRQVLPDHVSVSYRGELGPHEVVSTFSRYRAFVLPTGSENFGHAIAESLAASCPVICSANTLWTAVLAGGGGAVVDPVSVPELSRVLELWASKSPVEVIADHHSARDAFTRWRESQDDSNVLEMCLGRPGRRDGSDDD